MLRLEFKMNQVSCPLNLGLVWGPWTPWSPCGPHGGTSVRTRMAVNGGAAQTETKTCPPCPWSEWSPWQDCDCEGTQVRTRTCISGPFTGFTETEKRQCDPPPECGTGKEKTYNRFNSINLNTCQVMLARREFKGGVVIIECSISISSSKCRLHFISPFTYNIQEMDDHRYFFDHFSPRLDLYM